MTIQALVQIILGLLGLTIVISVHELGHFAAARLFKVDVMTFSIGIGKKILVLKGKKTEWALSLLPLGGYCRLKGEQNFIQAWEEKSDEIPYEKGSLFSASWWQRIIIALAGPAANLIFGALILSLVSLIRFPINYTDPVIVPVSRYDNSTEWPVDKAGLEGGDRITAINGNPVTRFADIQENVILAGGKALTFTVERDGESFEKEIIPALNKQNGTGYIGVYPWITPRVTSVGEKSVFSFLSPGDLIISLNGRDVENTMDFFTILEESDNRVDRVTVISADNEIRNYTPDLLVIEGDSYPGFPYKSKLSPAYNPLQALREGTAQMRQMFLRTIQSTSLLFKGIELNTALSGPLRISWMTGEVALSSFSLGARAGFNRIIQFLALICSALAFVNLLPIPVLDGGQIVLYLIDGLRRKRLTPGFIYYYQLVGTVFVIFLALFATGNDLLFFLRS